MKEANVGFHHYLQNLCDDLIKNMRKEGKITVL